MKKLCFRLFLTSAYVSAFCIMYGQVSVIATAGDIGPTTYSTLKATFTAINLGTHQGAINILLTGNTTETSSATLRGSGLGDASYTSVLIKPAAATNPGITGNFGSPLLVFDGARHVTVDGSNLDGGNSKDLTISNTSTSGSAILFKQGASNNVVKNAILRSAHDNSGVLVFSESTALAGNNHNTTENNDITGNTGGPPAAGIYNIGTNGNPNTGNIFRNNRIFDFAIYGFLDGNGFDTGFSDSTLVEGNEFYSTFSQSWTLTAVGIDGQTGIRNMTISKNHIHSLRNADVGLYGIFVFNAVSVRIVNNFICLSHGSGPITGIRLETSVGAVINIVHNSVYISGTTYEINSYAFFKGWTSDGDFIYNNIFVNTRVNTNATGTRGQYAFLKIYGGTFVSDYNDLVSTGNNLNYVGGAGIDFTPTRYVSLADWQAGTFQDAHSISVTPVFETSTDLHLVPGDNIALDNFGTRIGFVSTDFDGDIRNATAPDMGADEFSSSGTGVERLDASITGVLLLPNLVDDIATLRVYSERKTMINWMIIDMHGKVVLVFRNHAHEGQNDFSITLSQLGAGAYQMIGQTTQGRTEVERFIKPMF